MQFREYKNYDATGLAELIQRKEVHPSELMNIAFKQLHQVNPQLNMITHHREEAAKKRSKSISCSECCFFRRAYFDEKYISIYRR